MDKTREEFTVWIRQAINDRKSGAYNELYQFLVSCFVRADESASGKVDLNAFDNLIEEAAVLPRRYGFAPTSDTMFASDGVRKTTRAKQFLGIDKAGTGYITLDQWVAFAVNHIVGKIARLPKDCLGGSADNVTKEEFISFIRKAVDVSTPEYRELYFFLLKTFQAGDVNREGRVGPEAFDKMIEAAAAAPRRYGLAPSTASMFKTESVSANKSINLLTTLL